MNRDELSVYADQLQIEGDIRGEIIALELLLDEVDRPDLAARREALMTTWLGNVPRDSRRVRFRYGFVDCTSADLETVLASQAGPFVRSVFLSGTNTDVLTALVRLAAAPRPWLSRLSITTGRRWGERRTRTSALVDAELAHAVITATPTLSSFDVTGSWVFDAFPHPAVQRLRIVGHDAVAALAEAGPGFPAARSLFYAFSADPRGRIAFGERGLPRTLLARATLPALVELDVSANELQREWGNDHVPIFELLGELGVLPQLAHLRVPPCLGDDESAAIDQVRSLTNATIEDTADRPRPLHDDIDTQLDIRLDGTVLYVSHRRLGELMSAAWPSLDNDDRAAWFALWHALGEVPREREYDYLINDGDGTPVSRATFAVALATLGDSIDDDFAIATLAHVAETSTKPHVLVRRHLY